LARVAIAKRRQQKKPDEQEEKQKLSVASSLAVQHQEEVRPRLDADEILENSIRQTDEELEK
jgi:hypothetical protein